MKKEEMANLMHPIVESVMAELIYFVENNFEDDNQKINFLLDIGINIAGNVCLQTLKNRKINTIKYNRDLILSKMNDWFNFVIKDIKFENTLN